MPLTLTEPANGQATDVARLTPELTDWDHATFQTLVSMELSEDQRRRVVQPKEVYPKQEAVLAVHWHAEFVPLDLVEQRIDATFPNRQHELIIPTDHNLLNSRAGYTGVEVDCYSRGFARKVQLLIHFEDAKVKDAATFRSMLAHTFSYRTSQLYEFMATIVDPVYDQRLQLAAARTGADEALIDFVKGQIVKIRALLDIYDASIKPMAIKNKLLANWFDTLRDLVDGRTINRAQVFLRTVKEIVKVNFTLEYFYRTSEVIEEARSLGAGIVIPHPEQFWPILLADYDVDGYEVWNPQSREYTDFLINVVIRQNRTIRRGQRPILIFMGDDCHMGEKVKEPRHQDPDKSGREIGVQRAWDDLAIRKNLIIAGIERKTVIAEYKTRLAG